MPVNYKTAEIRRGISAHDQEFSFTNATLQSVWRTGEDGTRELANVAFSIAAYVAVPEYASGDIDSVIAFLRRVLDTATHASNGALTFEVEIGPEEDEDEDECDHSEHIVDAEGRCPECGEIV